MNDYTSLLNNSISPPDLNIPGIQIPNLVTEDLNKLNQNSFTVKTSQPIQTTQPAQPEIQPLARWNTQPIQTQQPEEENQTTHINNTDTQDTLDGYISLDNFKFGLDLAYLKDKTHATNSLEDAIEKAKASYTGTVPFDIWKRNIDNYLERTKRSLNKFIPSIEQYRTLLTFTDRQSIEASPGSGKTTSMVHKLVLDGAIMGYDFQSQIVLTFSEQAADDMRYKYVRAITPLNLKPCASFYTIHAYSKKIKSIVTPGVNVLDDKNGLTVRIEIQNTDNNKDQNYDEDEDDDFFGFEDEDDDDNSMYEEKKITSLSVISEAIDLCGLSSKYKMMLKDLPGFINTIVEKDIKTEEAFRSIETFASDTNIKLEDLQKIYRSARQLRLKYNCIDFTDMLLDTYFILKDTKTLDEVKSVDLLAYIKMDAIYIDEFQDISPLQLKIVNELLRLNPKARLYCVGDTDQAIYGFRGAEPNFLLSFNKLEFNRGKDVDTTYFTVNRRSTKGIIDLANKFIYNNKVRYDKSMVGIKEGESTIRLHTPMETKTAIPFIMEQIKEEYQKDGSSLLNMAVMARENIVLIPIVAECIKNRIPLNIKSNLLPTNLKEYRDILGIMEFVRYTNNPYYIKQYAHKVIKDMTRADSEIIAESARVKNLPFTKFISSTNRTNRDVDRLRKLYKLIRANAKMEEIIKLITQIYKECYYDRFNATQDGINQANQMLEEFYEMHYKEFLNHKAKFDDWVTNNTQVHGGLIISSMHRVKGLEFDKVIIYGLGEKYTPKASILSTMKSEYIPNYIEEERRLLYVGITRAKDELDIYFETQPGYFYKEVEEALNGKK